MFSAAQIYFCEFEVLSI